MNKSNRPSGSKQDPAPKLTKRQQDFISEYAKTGNGTKSARLAGYTGNPKTLGVTASRLLAVDSIRTEVDNMSRLATKRIQTIITDGKEHNALTASMYILDQKLGKARQSVEVTSNVLSVTLDLTGGAYGANPSSDTDTPLTTHI